MLNDLRPPPSLEPHHFEGVVLAGAGMVLPWVMEHILTINHFLDTFRMVASCYLVVLGIIRYHCHDNVRHHVHSMRNRCAKALLWAGERLMRPDAQPLKPSKAPKA